MAVYTDVSFEEATALLLELDLGQLTGLTPCQGGIENTNYFVSTLRAGQTHHYVLTLFERLSLPQLPFYLQLMQHLAQRGIALPRPHPDRQQQLAFLFKGKPAAVVDRLQGQSELAPGPQHCDLVATMLARMHLAGGDFPIRQPHLRGLSWWNETAALLTPHLDAAQRTLLHSELAFQNALSTTPAYAALPRGPIHADLFRDNVMFNTSAGKLRLSGFFDFYFAGVDTYLFDLAVCLNDWCINPQSATQQAHNATSFIASYAHIRPLLAIERELLPGLLRAAALRFWISRLWDFYQPRQASVLQPHDASHFERVLRQRIHSDLMTIPT